MSYTLQFQKSDTLAAQMLVGATTGTLTSGNFGSPASAQLLVIDYDVPAKAEVVLTTISGTALSGITRAQDGTTAVQHEIGAKIMMAFVPSHFTNLGGIAAADAWTNYTPSVYKNDGTTSLAATVTQSKYFKFGKTIIWVFTITGIGDPSGAGVNLLLPFASASLTANIDVGTGYTTNGTTTLVGRASIGSSTPTKLTIFYGPGTSNWAASNAVTMTIIYESAS